MGEAWDQVFLNLGNVGYRFYNYRSRSICLVVKALVFIEFNVQRL
jgi:hypothetical protein